MLLRTCAASSGVLGESSITRLACWRTELTSASSSGPAVSDVFEHFDPAGGERVGLLDCQQPEPRQPVDDDRLVAVGELEELQDHAGDADGVQVGVLRVFDVAVFLRDDADDLFARHDLVEQRLALGPADVQRHDGAGEDDDVADRQDRQDVGAGRCAARCRPGADDRARRRFVR